MKSKLSLTLGVLAILGIAISAAAPNASSIISACVNKNSGSLRIATKCLKTETALKWNQFGEQGLQGLPGEKGETGAQGLKGETGLTGPAGPAGPAGMSGGSGPSGLQGPTGYFQVYDAAGTKLGPLVMGDAQSRWAVLWNGIPIPYFVTSGKVADNSDGYYYINSDCTGDVYFRIGSVLSETDTSTLAADWDLTRRFSNSDPLFVTKVESGSRVGTKLMVAVSSTARLQTKNIYHLGATDEAGNHYSCDAVNTTNYFRYFQMSLATYHSPADGVGPLTIRVG